MTSDTYMLARVRRLMHERSCDVLDRASRDPVGEPLLGRVVERGCDRPQGSALGEGLGPAHENLLDPIAAAPVAAHDVDQAETTSREQLEEPELHGLRARGARPVAKDERLRRRELPAD